MCDPARPPQMLRLLAFVVFASSAALAQVAPPRVPEGVKALRDLAYVEGGHERQKLDLYLPEKKAAGPLPVLIWVHGGGWQNGSKEGCPPLRAGYVQQGYAVASLNYRLSGHAVFPAQIEDCKAAIRWLRAHAAEYGLDARRFGVWGSSAGGHLVALLGTSGEVRDFEKGAHLDQPSAVQAVCDFYGPTDFTVFVSTPGYESHATDSSPEAKLLGGAVMANRDKAARVNPITYVDKADPPFLIVHGDKDPTVPLNQSELLYEALAKAGVSARLHTIRGAGHGGAGFAGKEIEEMVAAFFKERLMENITRVEARTTESQATAAAGGQPGMRPGAGGSGGRPGIPWEVISRRDDADGDGKVRKAEFSGPAALFDRLDRNGDGVLTREEHEGAGAAPPAGRREPAPATPATEPQAPAKPTGSPGSGAAAVMLPGLRVDGERWTLERDGHTVRGILLLPEGRGPFPAVLISHGLGGSAEGFGLMKARDMVRWGVVCIAPEYTHAGRQAREADRATLGASEENLRRASACLDVLKSLPQVDARRLAAYGHSMGGFVTVGLAARHPGVLGAAAITGSGLAEAEGMPAPTPAVAAKIRTPFLMLHGADDTTVRPEQSLLLKRTLDAQGVKNDRLIADGQGHPIDQTMREEVLRLVQRWFAENGVLTSGR